MVATYRAAVIADSHFFDAPSGRFAECIHVHDFIAQDIAQRNVDAILHSGDIFERKSSPTERDAVAQWLQALAEIAPVLVVRGNHDVPLDLAIFGRLEGKHPITVEEAVGVHGLRGVVVGAVAWPTKASVLATLAAAEGVAQQDSDRIAADALRNVLRWVGNEMDIGVEQAGGDVPKILLMHAMVRGSRVSSGQPLVGCDLELGIEDLSLARADFIALGHIHLPQEWTVQSGTCNAPVVYPGSPRRTSFGETESKGYIIADFEGSKCMRWERIATPCAPMFLIEDQWGVDPENNPEGARSWVVGWHGAPERSALVGAEVRFRYYVPSDMRAEARVAAAVQEAKLRDMGAIDVKVEEVVQSTATARAPEVALARTLTDKLMAYWRARQTEPVPPRDAALLGKARDLEGKCDSTG
ncbi:MAG TPA: metallophosphoesterase family protein [Steroidobacteraceae bacterium]|jgi:exonuclease SbcD|nr:metallophosphoesterase family protein [Steroidobacteraceae bacterium]